MTETNPPRQPSPWWHDHWPAVVAGALVLGLVVVVVVLAFA